MSHKSLQTKHTSVTKFLIKNNQPFWNEINLEKTRLAILLNKILVNTKARYCIVTPILLLYLLEANQFASVYTSDLMTEKAHSMKKPFWNRCYMNEGHGAKFNLWYIFVCIFKVLVTVCGLFCQFIAAFLNLLLLIYRKLWNWLDR